MTVSEHDTHVAGGVARWAPKTDWRATYGETPRLTRKQLVDQAKARLAGVAAFASSNEGPKQEVVALSALSSEQHSLTVAGPPGARQSLEADGSAVRAGTSRGSSMVDRQPNGSPPQTAPSTRSSVQVERPARTPARAGRTRSQVLVDRDEFLVRTHDELTTTQQAEQLGISVGLVTKHRGQLARNGRISIQHRLSDHRPWTPEDVEWFRANIGRPWPELEAHLGRSYKALIVAAKRVDTDRQLRKANRGTMNAHDVALILGVDLKAVTHQLIKWGLLKAARSTFLMTNAGGGERHGVTYQHAIKRDDVVEFLLDYPWQYDRERITDPFFRRVADEAWKRDPLYTTTQAAEILGFKGQHGPSSFFLNTAPKYLSREQLVLRRRGNPKATRPRSFTGMQCFVPRSTIRAIQASGWVNYRTVLEDPDKWTAEKAAEQLYADPHRPPFITRSLIAQRVRRFMESGAIATKTIEFKGGRRSWKYATPAAVRELLPAIFVRESVHNAQRLNAARRNLLARHEPELLRRPRDLALQQATGELGDKLHTWFELEQRAVRDLHWRTSRSWALVTKHVARTLESIGPKTKIGGRKRLRTYHLGPCSPGLVEVPLWLARKRGLETCEHCEFESKFRRKRTGALASVVTCVMCRTTYRRGRGRPPKLPTCATCRQKRAA